ncbi:SpoIIE family protein phosphatase [Frankia sp. R82]|uniref:SpoIIE family protein phosphatase n=1 Tax=Frankia sp. R82 TaxID=2950553 RepID=UPI0020449E62|nr:SpoIIE family protein phosphatase [Frankia sp. R82]MCM3882556.1 SpoIIE family protein phosphatase [Frankia sp. R82]
MSAGIPGALRGSAGSPGPAEIPGPAREADPSGAVAGPLEGPLTSPLDGPVDLTNCDREPIHIPGSVQPHGVLLAVRTDADLTVARVSANVAEALGREPGQVLGRPLREVAGRDAAKTILDVVRTAFDLREASPVDLLLGDGDDRRHYDALLHRVGELVVCELQAAQGVRPLTYVGTYARTRQSVLRLDGSSSLAELYDVVVEEVRRLTGFDRVMVYRFDPEWNGEVVAEARLERLNSFLGLHYPATDIPVQARALYERSWLRLIPDVDYRPVPVVPGLDPSTGAALDLSDAWLRSVSPIHLEYLRNMGVTASMSISLLRDGRLWGLIACHHYSGAHEPGYEVCAAAEFLGHLFSLRLVAREEEQHLAASLASRRVLDQLVAAAQREGASLADQLAAETVNLSHLIDCSGAVVAVDGEYRTVGEVPPRAVARAVFDTLGAQSEILACDAVPVELPQFAGYRDIACGMLAFRLSRDEGVAWFRPETVRTVDWGGDPENSKIIAAEGDEVRLSPRRSFERWRQVVRDRARTWTSPELALADELRQALTRVAYARARQTAALARLMQESLLPQRLASIRGFELESWYKPAATDRVGGDWYDAIPMADGRVAVVVGDVAGHGIAAAGTMAQLRGALRAYVVALDPAPARASSVTGLSAPRTPVPGSPAPARLVLDQLGRLVDVLLPEAIATVIVAVVDPATGTVEIASSGHPPPLRLAAAGAASVVDLDVAPPVGAVDLLSLTPAGTAPVETEPAGTVPAGTVPTGPPVGVETVVQLGPGDTLVLFSDGVTERRGEAPDVGIERLRAGAERVAPDAENLRALGDDLFDTCRDPDSDDDATLLLLRRQSAATTSG